MIQSLSGFWFDPAIDSAFFAVVERLNNEDGELDQSIETRLKRSRIMRIREYALGNDEFTDGKFKPLLPGVEYCRRFRHYQSTEYLHIVSVVSRPKIKGADRQIQKFVSCGFGLARKFSNLVHLEAVNDWP